MEPRFFGGFFKMDKKSSHGIMIQQISDIIQPLRSKGLMSELSKQSHSLPQEKFSKNNVLQIVFFSSN